MLAISHIAIGGAAGEIISNVPLSLVAGIALHFVADKTIHYFPKELINKEKVAFLDWTVSALIIIYLYFLGFSSGLIAGALGGLLVDVALLPIKVIRESKIGAWHIKRQTHTRNYFYLFKEVAVVGLGGLLIWWFK